MCAGGRVRRHQHQSPAGGGAGTLIYAVGPCTDPMPRKLREVEELLETQSAYRWPRAAEAMNESWEDETWAERLLQYCAAETQGECVCFQ